MLARTWGMKNNKPSRKNTTTETCNLRQRHPRDGASALTPSQREVAETCDVPKGASTAPDDEPMADLLRAYAALATKIITRLPKTSDPNWIRQALDPVRFFAADVDAETESEIAAVLPVLEKAEAVRRRLEPVLNRCFAGRDHGAIGQLFRDADHVQDDFLNATDEAMAELEARAVQLLGPKRSAPALRLVTTN